MDDLDNDDDNDGNGSRHSSIQVPASVIGFDSGVKALFLTLNLI